MVERAYVHPKKNPKKTPKKTPQKNTTRAGNTQFLCPGGGAWFIYPISPNLAFHVEGRACRAQWFNTHKKKKKNTRKKNEACELLEDYDLTT